MLDIPRLFTAVAEWGVCVIYISFSKKRASGVALLPVFALAFGLICGWQYAAYYFPLFLWPLGMTVAVVLMVLFMYCCCQYSVIESVSWGLNAFIIAEFIASVEWQLYYYFYNSFGFAQEAWFKYLWFVIIYSLCFVVLWIADKKLINHRAPDNSLKSLVMVVIIVLVCFITSNLNFLYSTDGWDVQITEKIFEIRTLVDLCGIALVYTYRISQDRILHKQEADAMQDILEKQYINYCRFKENNEALNRHYHDLKHQIELILGTEDHEKRSEYLKEMQVSIKVRQSEYNSGNEVVDTILSCKSLDCLNANITFSAIADGSLLDFMSVMDICSVLGNSIDNAIEGVSKISEADKRIIQLSIFKQNNLTVYRIKNYIEDEPIYINNEIATSKKDKANHGFGLKSIRYVAEKYGGSMKVAVKDNWFTLCLLFPRG